jgi:hypothetical protein
MMLEIKYCNIHMMSLDTLYTERETRNIKTGFVGHTITAIIPMCDA